MKSSNATTRCQPHSPRKWNDVDQIRHTPKHIYVCYVLLCPAVRILPKSGSTTVPKSPASIGQLKYMTTILPFWQQKTKFCVMLFAGHQQHLAPFQIQYRLPFPQPWQRGAMCDRIHCVLETQRQRFVSCYSLPNHSAKHPPNARVYYLFCSTTLAGPWLPRFWKR